MIVDFSCYVIQANTEWVFQTAQMGINSPCQTATRCATNIDVLKIVQKEIPILRKAAKEVALTDVQKPKIGKIIKRMSSALEKCEDGVALAAPQIGESVRVFVVSPKVFLLQEKGVPEKTIKKEGGNLIYINPVIIKKSVKKTALDEGCLSVKGVFGKIKRHEKVTITAYDELGRKFTRGASGLLAEIFQHEVDHLNGILFIDSATDLVKVEKNKK